MTDQTEIRHKIGGNGTFVLRTLSGSVHLAAADGDEVVVVARSARGDLPELTVDQAPGRLLVEPPRHGLSFLRGHDFEIDFNVSVPRGARVDIKSVSADIIASDLAGEQDYKSVSGDVHLATTQGRVTIQTVSGDVHLNGGRTFELNAMTTSGDVMVEGELVDYLRVRTVSGDVRLTGKLSDGPRHTVETVSGDLIFRSSGGVNVESARALDIGRNSSRSFVIGDGAASLSFRSMSGEERVTGPADNKREPRERSEPAKKYDQPIAAAGPAPTAATPLDVLRALERGDIDVEEADQILASLSSASEDTAPAQARAQDVPVGDEARHLRVEITEGGKRVVNLRVPVNIASFAAGFVPGLPDEAAERIRTSIRAGLRGPIVDIGTDDGDRVLIINE